MKKSGTIVSVLIIIALIALVVYTQSHRETMPESTNTTTTTQSSNTTPMQPTETTTADGLKITIVKEGTGAGAVNGNSVSVNYTGMLTDGKVFDSNVDPKFGHVEPFTFTLGTHMVIAGWEEGVLGMKVGEKRHLVIPASLGYGSRGAGGLIPPNATLEFDVEVLSISNA